MQGGFRGRGALIRVKRRLIGTGNRHRAWRMPRFVERAGKWQGGQSELQFHRGRIGRARGSVPSLEHFGSRAVKLARMFAAGSP